ncbi:hypothetical protein LMG6001_01532 [Achromobacter insolitus]|uniref:DUF1254 domain-containing protein n=1 Tax=Achromobacter insolitus TaxID=217204 RepID=UPI001467EDBF|nr:DUF1254 domain-containing protein [Achromobacter insolitus]CAB3947426.1 hypothetical protein LMG6001_01532 [Achromobacter insolitus]
MKLSRRKFNTAGVALLAAGSLPGSARAAGGFVADFPEAEDQFSAAIDAYVYAYPLVTMEMTRRVITNVEAPKGTRAPMGHLIKLRHYPDAKFRDVTAPNADTLYTTAFFDVGDEPWVVSLPDLQDRYALFPMLDGWTTVFDVPGKRTTGTGAQTFVVTGPRWEGTVPKGMVQYKSPTSIVWLLGRIYCSGTPEDYAKVHKLQDEVKLCPLSAWGKDWQAPKGKVDPAIDMRMSVREQVNRMDAVEYFSLFAELLKRNPPSTMDGPILERLASIGIAPGKDFDKRKLDADFAKRLPAAAFGQIMAHFKNSKGDIQEIDGWGFTTKTGIYGTDYIQRALIAAIGLGANRPQDAVYPTSLRSDNGAIKRAYDGAERYVLTFKKGLTPPVSGFWSLTMYDADYFFVDNPLNRYSISARQPLKAKADGSIDLLIQNESPGPDLESNWLPAPKGKFILMLRLYWPNESDPSIINGSWTVPPVRRVT